jgi:hypothetical protein
VHGDDHDIRLGSVDLGGGGACGFGCGCKRAEIDAATVIAWSGTLPG